MISPAVSLLNNSGPFSPTMLRPSGRPPAAKPGMMLLSKPKPTEAADPLTLPPLIARCATDPSPLTTV